MIKFERNLSLLCALAFACSFQNVEGQTERTFVDSKGTEHVSTKEKPTVVMFAHGAVSLKHFGLTDEQLVGTYGEYYNSGSDVDVANPSIGSSLPADPEYDEIQFLEKVVDLSPSCHIGYCTEFDLNTFLTLDVDEVIYQGYLGAWWGLNETYTATVIEKVTEKTGKPPIFIEVSKEGAEDCPGDPRSDESVCPGRSMIDIIETNFELATYLNLDIPESVNEDRKALCSAAMEFQQNMQIAHDNGVRVMAAYLGTGTSYFADPTSDSVLRMFEELGMPIFHVGKCDDCSGNYFWEYMPLGNYFQSCADGNVTSNCNHDPLYPVDFWLYDHRTTMILNSPDFTLGFPDRALLAGQKGYWPIGGRLFTPNNAAEILSIVGPQVAASERVHPASGCVPEVDVTGAEHRAAGLSGGEYACYNEAVFHNSKYFEVCKFFDPPAPPVESTAKPACYDMSGSIGGQPHNCICTAKSCSEDLCNGNGGIWANECEMACDCENVEEEEEPVVVVETVTDETTTEETSSSETTTEQTTAEDTSTEENSESESSESIVAEAETDVSSGSIPNENLGKIIVSVGALFSLLI